MKSVGKGYEKKVMKTMFGKRYEVTHDGQQIDEKKGCMHNHQGEECPVHGKKACPDMVEEAVRMPAKTGNLVNVIFRFRSQILWHENVFPNGIITN